MFVNFAKFLYNSGMEQNEENLQSLSGGKLLFETGVTYSVASALPIVVSLVVLIFAQLIAGEAYADTQGYKYCTYLMPQLCFAAAAFVYFKRTRLPVRTVCTGCKWYYFLLAVLLQFGLLSLSELNGLFLKGLSYLGYEQAPSTLPDVTGWNLIPAFLVIAIFPAVFEEVIFRGILSKNMKAAGWGTAATVLVAGAMFSLFHTNPAQTIYQFICGMCFTLVALRSGSVFPSMLSHFLNNAVVLCLISAGIEDYPSAVKIPLYSVAGIVLAGVLVYLIFFDRKNGQKGGVKEGKKFFLGALAGIVLCAVMWISVFVSGCVHG